MGVYNILHATLTCPRCGEVVETTVDCYFVYVGEMQALKVGDRYPWRESVQPQNGGRPLGGSTDGEGYVECPRCHKDAHLRVLVRNDVIIGVAPDPDQSGYIPD